ncbi:hypothetical protein DP73_09555 [Desulfosporosinus sp. HMP52]|uniref:hypothetical protein n=1 Tax=Desulfosporosinus sp. HMP52 TaxID=1487923 RepID=UPI00051FE55C|nr:hypothetical protein [Desulfosporosinus sp. HMP52]KGK89862.1 hypothetical protein DP73_09555 [Desulfosporosinus sp. HMP52]
MPLTQHHQSMKKGLWGQAASPTSVHSTLRGSPTRFRGSSAKPLGNTCEVNHWLRFPTQALWALPPLRVIRSLLLGEAAFLTRQGFHEDLPKNPKLLLTLPTNWLEERFSAKRMRQ